LGETASAIPILCPKSPKAEHLPNHDPFEEVKFISLFISQRFPCETEHPSSPSLKHKPCPSGPRNVILNNG
jgi:hypothetical protein